MSHPAEAQLSYLGFRLIAPSASLRPYVSSYWYFQQTAPLHVYHEEYMHPTGGFGIAFNLGDSVRLDNQSLTSPVFLDGANTRSRKMGFLGQVEMIGIRFVEGGAYPFMGIPLVELQNELNVLDALGRTSLLRLHEQLLEAPALPGRVALLEGWLMERISNGKSRSPIIPASLERLRVVDGGDSIPELAQELAISQRQLERLFQSQVGMSPKQFFRLQRVEAARLALRQNRQSNTRLAVELGFYDQAHFIREFSAVVGMTPYAYMKRKHESLT